MKQTLLTLIFSISLGSTMLSPVFAATQDQIITQKQQNALKQLRLDWKKRDPQLSGPAFIAEENHYKERIMQIIQGFENALIQNSKNINAYLGLAEVKFIYLKRYQPVKQSEIESLLQEALKVDPKHTQAIIAWAEYIYFHVPKTKKPLSNQALYEQHMTKRKKAMAFLRQSHKQQPQNIDLSLTFADLLSYESQLEPAVYQEAIQVLDTNLKASPTHLGLGIMKGRVLVRLGLRDSRKVDQTQFQAALDQFKKVLIEHPDDAVAHLEMAQVALQLKNTSLAISTLQSLTQKHPKDTKALFLLAEVLLKKHGKDLDQDKITPAILEIQKTYQTLLADLETHTLGNSELVIAYTNLGMIAYTQGKVEAQAKREALALNAYKAAIQRYTEALAIFDKIKLFNALVQKELAKSYYAYGQLLKQTQDEQGGQQALRKACDLEFKKACKAF